jgi:hypothetical protein
MWNDECNIVRVTLCWSKYWCTYMCACVCICMCVLIHTYIYACTHMDIRLMMLSRLCSKIAVLFKINDTVHQLYFFKWWTKTTELAWNVRNFYK